MYYTFPYLPKKPSGCLSFEACELISLEVAQLSWYSNRVWAGWSGFNSWQGQDSSLLHSIKTGSGAQPVSYTMDTTGCFPRSKVAGGEADHSPPSSAEVKNGGAMPPFPHMSSWCGA
jgi:hypothetical protein